MPIIEEKPLNETIQAIIDAMVLDAPATEESSAIFYERRYYREPGIYRLPELIQPVMFDLVRKMGSVTAIKSMQRIIEKLGFPLKIDGLIGPRTVSLAAISCNLYGKDVMERLSQENIAFYARKSERKAPHKPNFDNRITDASLRAEQVKIVKSFGVRMREAREIANFTQVQAAVLLGYSNSSKLAKVEGASDTNSVPLWLIPKAAYVYDVSTDFLFGISNDWERDPTVSRQRNIGHWIFDYWKSANAAQVSAFVAMGGKLSALEKAVAVAVNRSQDNLAVLRRVQELNTEFEELKGGAKLVLHAQESVSHANKALAELKRFHCLIDAAGSAGVVLAKNGDIFDYGENG